MCCLNYGRPMGGPGGGSGGGGGGGGAPPDMQSFMNEPVDFDDPEGHRGYSQKMSVQMKQSGQKTVMTKVVTREYKMADGSTQTVVKEISKEL